MILRGIEIDVVNIKPKWPFRIDKPPALFKSFSKIKVFNERILFSSNEYII